MSRSADRVGDEPFDAKSIAQVIRGEDEAFDRWYRREHPEVHRLCLGFLADATEADDLAQDAMLHLMDVLQHFDRTRSYSAWRTAVVLNLCRDRLRRTSARRRAESVEVRETSPLPCPEDAAERAETRAVLLRSLEALTPREREVFVLHDLEELSTERVAELCDIGASSVRSLLALARRRLRNLLGARLADSRPGTEGAHGS